MASAWGQSWGDSWGESWGTSAAAVVPVGGGAKHPRRLRINTWDTHTEDLSRALEPNRPQVARRPRPQVPVPVPVPVVIPPVPDPAILEALLAQRALENLLAITQGPPSDPDVEVLLLAEML